MTIRFKAAFLGVLAVLAISVAHAADPSTDCQYLQGDGHSGRDLWSSAHAAAVSAPGCVPQCVARVYCASEHPKLDPAKISDEEKYLYSYNINCDANPQVDPNTYSCPFADKCHAQYAAQAFRKAVAVTPSRTGTKGDAVYGLDFNIKNAPTYTYEFPSLSGDTKKDCHLCISTASISIGRKRLPVCPAKNGPTWSCDNATDCLAAQDKSDGALVATVVQDEHIEYVAPISVTGPAPAAAAAGGAATSPSSGK